MVSEQEARQLMGTTAYDQSGSKLGKVGQVFLDDQTGQPEWITVQTGMFGAKESFVPISTATVDGDRVTVPYDKDLIKDAPSVDVDGGHLSQDEEAQLYRHYGLQYSEQASDSGLPAGGDEFARQGRHEASGTASTDDAMTRSEEELRVGKEQVEQGRARLRKYVVTEEQQVPVTTTREEVRLEREPITDANRDEALQGAEISEAEHEVTLRAERPVVEKEAVPVERVRLGKEQVAEEQTVSGEVRKEQIDFDDQVNEVSRNRS